MKLYLLKRRGSIGYDEYASFVVRAESEDEARRIAADACGFSKYREIPDAEDFKDAVYSTCKVLKSEGVEGEAGVILGSFNAG